MRYISKLLLLLLLLLLVFPGSAISKNLLATLWGYYKAILLDTRLAFPVLVISVRRLCQDVLMFLFRMGLAWFFPPIST